MEDGFTRLVTWEARSSFEFSGGSSCKSSGGEQSGLKLKVASSDTGSQQHGAPNWTSDEKWANFHHLSWCESFIFSLCCCAEKKVGSCLHKKTLQTLFKLICMKAKKCAKDY